MRILALGGTQFVGRAFVEAAIAEGHDVTVLHRGRSALPEGWKVTEILADRDGGLDALGTQAWDAVYDSSGYVPRLVRAAAHALKERCRRYLFISTISVFDFDLNIQRGATPLDTETVTGDTYGPLKVECEDALNDVLGDRATIVRPGLVIGPHDPTGRFAYWVNRFAAYGEVLTPEIPAAPIQLIDARDLGEFSLKLLEGDRAGVFHVAGEPSLFGTMIAACAMCGGGTPVYVPVTMIEAQGVRLGVDLPLVWGPEADKMFGLPCRESLDAGLLRRPLGDSTSDTLAWLLTLQENRPVGSFDRARELAVLDAMGA